MYEFLQMGGYAEFVWSSFGLAAATLVFNVISARKKLRMTLEKVAMRAARQNDAKESPRGSDL
jgi:heme exporter protein CcmD